MPRANRFHLSNYVWHITHRCHQRVFLLKFARDRQRWRYWLFEARKRFGLCVLNYVATSNHIHLLVRDRGKGEISRSMQLISGRTAHEYNQRKQRSGAFGQDRYHATSVDTEEYLGRTIIMSNHSKKLGKVVNVDDANAVFLPVKSVGVVDDARGYEYVVTLRAVKTVDFMTARFAHLPFEFLEEVSRRIINEVTGISRVAYDISSKPPATIEWE